MIKTDDAATYEAALSELSDFGAFHHARGRFIALYLGLKLMGDRISPLGSDSCTTSREIENFLDRMWTKTHQALPRVVLSAPFGNRGTHGGYSALTGTIAPENSTTTNTWRNNFNSQKGIGCVATPAEIENLLTLQDPRAACQHYRWDGSSYACAITGARYRGEAHSIWLRRDESAGGFQVVNLDEVSVFEPYLRPNGARIPLYPLLAVLYSFAPHDVYPARREVTRAEFEADFGFSAVFTDTTFDCDPASVANDRVLAISAAAPLANPVVHSVTSTTGYASDGELPPLPDQVLLNSGLEAELTVARILSGWGWTVRYTGGEARLGYDLRAETASATLHVEVKSSVGFATPILTESEWTSALHLGDSYVLAVVDHVGSDRQAVRFVRDPAGAVHPSTSQTTSYRLARGKWGHLAVNEVPPPEGSRY